MALQLRPARIPFRAAPSRNAIIHVLRDESASVNGLLLYFEKLVRAITEANRRRSNLIARYPLRDSRNRRTTLTRINDDAKTFSNRAEIL